MDALRSLRTALTSGTTIAVFGFLALVGLLPEVVDVYASPVYRILFLPSYLVTMLFYDGAFGLEALVYPVVRLAEPLFGDGHLLWEAGRVVTFYLFALAVGWLVAAMRSRNPPGNRRRNLPSDSDATQTDSESTR